MPFNHFIKDSNETVQDVIEWNDYNVGFYISKNRGKSSSNEDVVFLNADNKALFFGVADGAGGHPRGKDAAFICGQEVMSKSPSKLDKNPVEFFESANEKILALKAGARTTFSFGMLESDMLKCFSVGDSEIIYWNSQGTELYSNIPQTEVGYKIEAGVLDQEASLDDEDRYLVNNLMGDSTIRIESTSKMILKKGHTILVGSDGLFDNLSHEQLKSIIFPGDMKESFEQLCAFLNTQDEKTWKKDDDISFVLIRKTK